MAIFTLWLLFLVGGGTMHSESRFSQTGEQVVGFCMDDDADGECDTNTTHGGGVAYGGLN